MLRERHLPRHSLSKSLPSFSTHSKLPCNSLTYIQQIGNDIWFGSLKGTFSLHPDGQISHYQGERWLPSDEVVSINAGPDSSVLIATQAGLTRLHKKDMALSEKADFYLQTNRRF